MRIGSDHGCAPASAARSRVASAQSDTGFAEALASAVESDETAQGGSPPELSAATYRHFAAVALERGDTLHAEIYLSRVPDAREPGIPGVESGALSVNGRWDYNEAAAALPETGVFDTASGQGTRAFKPYGTDAAEPAAEHCAPTETTTADAPPDVVAPDRLSTRGVARGRSTSASELRASIEAALLDRITG